ncbi:MAG: hypothetical protein EBR82_72230 [Caulobacteraceae bacterium]|nr:hypothetical protein [Caulobacteraceae bacterium]
MRPRGGIFGANVPPSRSTASGVWTLREATSYTNDGTWPGTAKRVYDDAAGTVAAYSLRKLFNNYYGPVITARRSSDNAERTFLPDQIVDGTLATWTGAGNNAFVKTWYDQSGNGYNLTQTTSANQPTIVNSGSVVLDASNPSVLMNGSSGYMDGEGQDSFGFGTNSFILECWVRTTAHYSVNQIFDLRVAGDGPVGVPRVNFALVSGAPVLYVYNAIKIQGNTLSLNTWTHLCVSRQNTSTRMFINGNQTGSTWTDSTTYTVGANRPRCGNNGDSVNSAQSFSGYIDQIRFASGVYRNASFTPPNRTGIA